MAPKTHTVDHVFKDQRHYMGTSQRGSKVIKRRMRIGHECPVYQVKDDFDEGCKDSVSAGVKEVSAVSKADF